MNDFVNRLMLEIGIERVQENLTIPERWRDGASHFRIALWRPGAREVQFQFSIEGELARPPELEVLSGVARSMTFYETYPSLLSWCGATGQDVNEIADTFHTFEQDRQSLMRFFGEFWEEFLSYGV